MSATWVVLTKTVSSGEFLEPRNNEELEEQWLITIRFSFQVPCKRLALQN